MFTCAANLNGYFVVKNWVSNILIKAFLYSKNIKLCIVKYVNNVYM